MIQLKINNTKNKSEFEKIQKIEQKLREMEKKIEKE